MLCIPIIALDTESAVNKISEAEKQADISEIRLDLMETFQLKEIIRVAKKPVIVTYRSEREGGKGTHDPSMVSKQLISAAHEKADYIDVELSMPEEWRNKIIKSKCDSRIIISTHIMENTPSMDDLNIILDDSINAGGDIIKIVTMANSLEDNLRMLELVSNANKKNIKVIAFCMGAMGRMSRIFSLLMGGYLTFTSLDAGEESAPGQIPIDEMKQFLKYFSV